jgi:hypothetical protein
MQELIDIREDELTADHAPKTALERMLIGEMARSGIQVEVCHARMVIHTKQMRETVDEWWDDHRRQAVNTLAARLPRDPGRVAQQLEASLHGALWCLENWRGLGASAAANGGLTEAQRQLMCDLMAISPLLRDNTEKVPAASDKERLLALVVAQVKRLENRITLDLNRRDMMARAKVKLGICLPQDPESRTQRSNESRAHKRFVWAFGAFNALRAGAAPETIIDPETGRPVHAPDEPKPSPTPAPAASAAASTSTSTCTSAAAPQSPPPSGDRLAPAASANPNPSASRHSRTADRASVAADALLNAIFDQEWRKIAAEVNAKCDPRYPRMSPEPPPYTKHE